MPQRSADRFHALRFASLAARPRSPVGDGFRRLSRLCRNEFRRGVPHDCNGIHRHDRDLARSRAREITAARAGDLPRRARAARRRPPSGPARACRSACRRRFQAYDPHPIVATRAQARVAGGRRRQPLRRLQHGLRRAVRRPLPSASCGRAIEEQLDDGTLFVTPCEANADVAELLAERYGLPMWRFTNSGTEATMDAIRVARGVTGRDKIVKVEGGYHGHHDEVMISMKPPLDEAGPADAPDGGPGDRRHHPGGARRHHRHPVQRPRRARAGARRPATSPASSSSR